MLTSIKVTGFKSLGSLEFEPAQVNVLIGANGSGKSNILEAIGVLGAAAAGRVDDQALLRRGVRPGVPILYKTALKGIRIPEAIYLEARWQQEVLYSVGINNPLEKPRPAWLYKTETVRRGSLSDFAIFAPVTPVLRGIAPDPAPRVPVGLFGGRLPEAVIPLLDRQKKRFGDLSFKELFTLLDWAHPPFYCGTRQDGQDSRASNRTLSGPVGQGRR